MSPRQAQDGHDNMLSHARISALIELSEANAYSSLVGAAAAPVAVPRPSRCYWLGGACALVSPQTSGTLNMNRVIGLGVLEPVTAELLSEIEALYGQHGLAFGVEVSALGRNEVLDQWLSRRRLRRTVGTAMRWQQVRHNEPAGGGVVVTRAKNSWECEDIARLCQHVFRVPQVMAQALVDVHRDPRWRYWMVRQDSHLLACAMSFVDDGLAWLGWDATSPQARGQGLQSALIAARLKDAAEAGCSHATAETAADTVARADPSGRNYEKLGFVLAYERTTYVAIRTPFDNPRPGLERAGDVG